MDGKRCNEEMRLISLASHCSTVLAVLTMIDTSCHVLNHGPKYVMYYVSVSVDLPEDEVSLTNRAAQSSPQSEPAHVASTVQSASALLRMGPAPRACMGGGALFTAAPIERQRRVQHA